MAVPFFSTPVPVVTVALLLRHISAGTHEVCDSSIHDCQEKVPPASLLQRKFQREVGALNELQMCDGVTSVGRCWYLSQVGQSCDMTCAAHGFAYSFAEPHHDMIPLLLGHSPRTKLEPWLFVECYVPAEDNYYPFNANAWGVPANTPSLELVQAGQYSLDKCQLSCPCAGSSPTPAIVPPSPPPITGYYTSSSNVISCSGIEQDGRCWYQSKMGASCDDTCAAYGCEYSFAAPSTDLVPRMIGHEPAGKQNLWLFLECYVPKEDRYHPANPNAWGVPEKTPAEQLADAGKYTYETCRLSCPCAGSCAGYVETPTPAPYVQPYVYSDTPVPGCDSVEADGACWYLSETGKDCDSTCAAKGMLYKFAAPTEDVIPRLVGHKPSARNNPWLFLECYVALEDRYHPFNKNAWGVPEKTPPEELAEAGQHTYPSCQLACPCGGRRAVVIAPTPEPITITQPPVYVTQPPVYVPPPPPPPVYVPPPPPPSPVVTGTYDGIEAVGRKWFMSGKGESCASTCAAQGLKFSWAAPSLHRPMTPLLIGHEPASKQSPWAFVECYVPEEDRYHTVNTNAWGNPSKTPKAELESVAAWTHDICRLACPCAAQQECGWVQPAACASEFEYKGKLYSGCPTADHEQPWCMHPRHTNDNLKAAPHDYEWSNCINTCDQPDLKERCYWKAGPACVREFNYDGTLYVGCTSVNHDTPWCSNSDPFAGSWSHCEYTCDNPTADDIKMIEQINKEVQSDDLLCSWRPVKDCSEKFEYKGVDYEGCAEFVDHPTPWCSHDRFHIGKWSQCERYCTRVG